MPSVLHPRTHALEALRGAKDKLARLQSIDPYLIDLSLRETPVGATIGQTLQDKCAILPQLRAFGLRNILLGTLNYALPDEPQVDDDFMQQLRASGANMDGCFAFTGLGRLDADGGFVPDASLLKLRDYGVPNTLLDISLHAEGSAAQELELLCRRLTASIAWLHQHVRGDGGGPPRILVNFMDGCDAMAQAPDAMFTVLERLAAEPIEGVSFEDERGTYMPFQIGAFVAAMRGFLPPPCKLLVHVHAGAGFENAAVIEALLNGADGVWGALPKRAASIGHASLGELMANLVRVGNPFMREGYTIERLLPLAHELEALGGEPSADAPIMGRDAYRLTVSSFRQRADRFMDLPPEVIGGRYGYRVCALVSNGETIAGRLAEVTGRAAGDFPNAVLERMVRLMRRDLRAGQPIDYDQPRALKALLARAEQGQGQPLVQTAAGTPGEASSATSGAVSRATDVDSGIYRALLESTRAIPWRIDWDASRFAYIGPQIEPLLGWPQHSWVTMQDWIDRIHPQDRDRVVNFCVSQSLAGVDHEADYRALTRAGDYVWIRDVVHVLRRADGSPEALTGFMFDINERKKTEEHLIELQSELEALSFKDGLTGVANRRRFDVLMQMEWANARRQHRPLSLLMLDIDHFKQYNDRYGHLAGDDCLRRVAQVLTRVVARPRDLVARFGGEEFALVLPETDAEAALKLARCCQQMLAAEAIEHPADGGGRLTVSIGGHTAVPQDGDSLRAFVDITDRRLYRAKRMGRDRIVASGADAELV